MRAALTTVAVIIILALVAALGAPLFVDWTSHRPQIEAALARFLGVDASLVGPIELRFLPSPHLHAAGATLRLAGVQVDAQEFTLDGQWTQLAGGAAHVSALSIIRPTITLPQRAVVDPAPAPLALTIDALHMVDGVVKRVGPDGTARALAQGVNFDGAVDLAGEPVRGALRLQSPVFGPVSGQIALGATAAGKTPLKAELNLGGQNSLVSFEGDLIGMSGWLADAAKTPRLLGKIGAAGKSSLFATLPTWSAVAKVDGGFGQGALSGVQVRLGEVARSLELDGGAQYDFSDRASVKLNLSAKTLDLDKAFAASSGALASPQDVMRQMFAALGVLAKRPADSAAIDAELALDSIVLGGQSIVGATLGWRQTDADTATVHVSAQMPALGSLSVDGALGLKSAPSLVGNGTVALDAPALWASWYGVDAPLAAWLANFGDMPIRAGGDAKVSADAMSSEAATVSFGATAFHGPVRWSAAKDGARAAINADLRSAKLDMGSALDVSAFAKAFADVDLSLTLQSDAIILPRAGLAELQGSGFAVSLKAQNGGVNVDRLTIDDFAGAKVAAHGAADDTNAHWEGKIDARDANGLAALADRLYPSAWTDWLVSRASALSPVAMTFALNAPSWTAMLAGRDDGTSVTAVGPGYDLSIERGRVGGSNKQKLYVKLSAADARRALTLMLGDRPLPAIGAVNGVFALDDDSGPSSKAALTAEGAFGALSWRGEGGFKDARFVGAGEGHLDASSASTMAELFGVHLLAKPSPDPALSVDAHVAIAADGVQFDALKGALGGANFTGSIAWAAPAAGAAASSDPTIRQAADVVGDAPPVEERSLRGAIAFDSIDLRSWPSLLIPAAQAGPPAHGPAPLFDGPGFALTMTANGARVLDWANLRGLKAMIDVGPSGLKISDLSASLGAGTIGGEVGVSRSAGVFSMSGEVSSKRMALPPPFAQGTVDLAAKFATTGETMGQLIAGVSGAGSAKVAGAVLPRADPGALRRVMQRMWQLDLAPEQPKVLQLLGAELDKAGLRVPDIETPVSIGSGSLSFGPIELSVPEGGMHVAGQVDLTTGAARTALRTEDDEKLKFWRGGPPAFEATYVATKDGAARTLDIDALLSGLTAQSLERAADRASTFEADIRERAYFIRREKAEKFMARRRVELAAFAAETARAAEAAKAAAAANSGADTLDNGDSPTDPNGAKAKPKGVVVAPGPSGLY